MRDQINIREWQKKFNDGEYNDRSRSTQCRAGWYDWFCNTSSLANKTKKMGKIIAKVTNGGKVDLDNYYLFFKNNCPCCYPLYDDFRFCDIETGDVVFTITIDCGYEDTKYTVYGRANDFEESLFKCNDSRVLVKWLNTPWEE